MRIIVVIVLLVLGGAARAQSLPATTFEAMSLDQAIEQSKVNHKIVVVYARASGQAFELMEEMTWTNPTLAAWIKWHAVAVRVSRGEDSAGWHRLEQALAERERNPVYMQKFPHVFFYANGRLVWVYPRPKFQEYFFENPLNFPDGGPKPQQFYPKAVQVLFEADMMMDQLRATRQVWFAQHEQACPEPARPVVPALSSTEDKDAPVVRGPDASRGEDVLSMLALARRQVEAHEYYDATGTYTWLWERGLESEPSLRPALRSFVLWEMARLSELRDGSRTRLLAIRRNLEAVQPWWAYTDILDWMLLSEAAKLSQESVNYLVTFTLDEQEATMLPRADRAAYALLGTREPFGDPREIGPKDLERLSRLATARNTAAPKDVTPEEWANVQALRRRMIEDEACRLYAAALVRGDAGQASRAAEALRGVSDDDASRLMLVMTAVVAGTPEQSEHATWVRQAGAHGVHSAALERHFAGEPAGAR
jgi:hypothetical protein